MRNYLSLVLMFAGIFSLNAAEKLKNSPKSKAPAEITRFLSSESSQQSVVAMSKWNDVVSQIKKTRRVPNEIFNLATKVMEENALQLLTMAEDLAVLMEDISVNSQLKSLWVNCENKEMLTHENGQTLLEMATRLKNEGN